MSPRVPILLCPLLAGCLTTATVNRTLERQSVGLETLSDPDGEHLAVEEFVAVDGVVELGVSTAVRELEVERYDLAQNTAERREWKQGGKVGRNVMWLVSATASWVGAFGVSWEGADGQRVQIGGLGGESRSWQGITALLVAAGGVGVGTQQTLAVKRDETYVSTLVATERVLRESRSLPEAPLASHSFDLSGSDLADLHATTDGSGRLSLSALQLPSAAWRSGLDVRSADGALAGRWQPSNALRNDLLQLPADWEAPFHASLLDEAAGLAGQVDEGGVVTDLPTSQLRTPGGVRGAVEPLPPEDRASQVQAWIAELEPLAQAAAAQRERIHLDLLRSAFRMTATLAPSVAASTLGMPEAGPELLNPLFQPMDVFRNLPDTATVTLGELRSQTVALPLGPPRLVLLEAGRCSVSEPESGWGYERVTLRCGDRDGGVVGVLVSTQHDLGLLGAEAWVVVGLLTNPTALEAGTLRSGWLPTVTPLYGASLGRTDDGQIAFVQVLDEDLLVESGVLRELGM